MSTLSQIIHSIQGQLRVSNDKRRHYPVVISYSDAKKLMDRLDNLEAEERRRKEKHGSV